MNECCQKALEEEWEEIRRWRPFLHWCQEWDGLLIDKGNIEFDYCHCFDDQVQTEPKEENLSQE